MLVRPHLSLSGTHARRMSKPDPSLLDDVVAPKVLDAMRRASAALIAANVRHVVCGGLAVGANGYPRATRDVDFLVGAEAFVHHAGGLVTMRPEVPFQVQGIAIDLLTPDATEPFLEAALAAPPGGMLDAPPLVYMKMKSPRRKDEVDIIEMLKGGIDRAACRSYLVTNVPDFVARFDALAAQSDAEQD